MAEPNVPHIGFGVLWNDDRAATWSHIPLSLLHGLDATGPVTDLGFDDELRRRLYRLAYLRIRDGRPTTTWRSSPRVMAAAARSIADEGRRHEVDAIVTVGDLGVFDRPSFMVQDLSYDLLEREIANGNDHAAAQFGRLTERARARLRDRQRSIFASAAGVFPMSHWYGRSLVEDSGFDPSQVHVMHPGANAQPSAALPLEAREPNALFVGRDFLRKGGELAVAAVGQLRDAGHELGLTVIGPDDWPLPGEPPPWVDFRGPRPVAHVADAMASHRVFLLPTRFEAFGIVFAEALRAGTPAVGPNHFAVPEIIRDGIDGALFDEFTVDAVAVALDRALADDVREATMAGVEASMERWTWERAAADVRAGVASVISA